MTVAGDHAYVVSGGTQYMESTLQVIDIGDPASPRIVGSTDTPGSALGVTVAGDHAYVADGESGLQVIDIGDPASPRIVGSTDTPGIAQGVIVGSDHAYVADGEAGLQVIDLRDPSSPRNIGSMHTPGLGRRQFQDDDGRVVFDVASAGNHVYVVEAPYLGTKSRLYVLHRQCDAATPVLLSRFSLSHVDAAIEIRWEVSGSARADAFRVEARSDAVRRDVAVQAEGRSSFVARDPMPGRNNSESVTYVLLWLDADGRWVELAHETVPLQGPPAVTRLLPPYPNPFNPQVTVPFALGTSQRVNLTVHDAAGREVAPLLQGEAPAGHHQVIWQGVDARGHQVGSGVYIARLHTPDGTWTRKLLLVR